MRRIRVVQWVSFGVLCLGGVIAGPVLAPAQQTDTTVQADTPVAEVLSPKDGERVPRKDEDPVCPEQGPCTKYYVRGRVAAGYWPFLAVAPLNAAPRIWVQPPITSVKRDGTFMGMVFLGTEKLGIGEKYNVFVFAHKDKNRLKEADVLMSIPDDCIASDPVTVLRTK